MKRQMLTVAVAAFAVAAFGREFQLRNVYSDHMLFQRDQPVVFAGYANPGEAVEVKMNGASAKATADAKGDWRVELGPMKAGGPYDVAVCGAKACLQLKDVLVGELWMASGQSNMEMPVVGSKWYSLTNGHEVASAANDPELRYFGVPKGVDCDNPHAEVQGRPGWSRGDNTNAVRHFSATAYFFGYELRRRLKVPVGIIASAWGGSRIEPWISEKVLTAHNLEKALSDLEKARNPEREPESVGIWRARQICRLADWVAAIEKTEGSLTKDAMANWMKKDLDERDWKVGKTTIDNPAIVWMRWQVELPADVEDLAFDMDFASDVDRAWFDGRQVGETGIDVPNYWSAKRHYRIGKAAAGRHVIAVRVQNHFGDGGVQGPRLVWGDRTLALDKVAPRVRTEAKPDAKTGPRPCCPWEGGPGTGMRRGSNIVPTSLYNPMIAPFDVFRCRGTIWYQGCSNAGEWQLYHDYQKALAESFRATFARPDMAFLCVQLAGYIQQSPERRLNDAEVAARPPSEQGFVMMRDEQARIREVPNCDCATAFDIGDHSDIHPKNKKEVGRRLAGLAEMICYGGKEKARGPQATKVLPKGGAVEVVFDEPIVLRGGKIGPREFALADEAGKLVWAEARLVAPNRVRIESTEVKAPVRVDYCRAPFVFGSSLCNRDGYPALPFKLSVK